MVQPAPPPRALPPPPAPAAAARRARTAAEIRRRMTVLGWTCAVLAPLVALAAVVGFRQGWISYGVAKAGLVALATPALALLGVVFGIAGLVLSLAKPRAGGGAAVGAVAVGAVVLAVWLMADRAAVASPPVHDVATDWSDPPTFSPKIMMARGPRANPVELAPAVPEGPSRMEAGFLGRPVAEVNRTTCPAAAPVVLTTTPAEAYTRVRTAVRALRMALQTDDPAGGRLEASAARGLWGVTDDLVARVRPEGAGARVDMRSIARAGLNDGGANCARVTRLRRALEG